MMSLIRLSWFLATLLLSATAIAVELEGYQLPERIKSPAGGPELVLNGAGVRMQATFKVYVAALYLPNRKDDGEAVLRDNQPSRLLLHLLREVTPEQVNSSINGAMQETLTPEQRAPLERRLNEFSAILEALPLLKKGMQIVIDYAPRAGTTIRVNGEAKGFIPGADFNQALLRTWIGERPRDTRLKNAMLGVP